ncbi:hypothetical protein NC652_030946 [Populus alba x Populus x berolinensis]|nr:hypothetical protein NC652_030946 [Populus alba x Populus x berolinensis]
MYESTSSSSFINFASKPSKFLVQLIYMNISRVPSICYSCDSLLSEWKFFFLKLSTGIKIMLSLDSDRQSGTVKIASTEHFSAEVNAEPERRLGTPKPSSPIPSPLHHYGTPPRNEGHKFSPPPPILIPCIPKGLYCTSWRKSLYQLISHRRKNPIDSKGAPELIITPASSWRLILAMDSTIRSRHFSR